MQNHDHGILADIKAQERADAEVVDLMGSEGVIFVAIFGAAAGTNKLVLESGDAADGSDHVPVNDSADSSVAAEVTLNATATVGILQCHKPLKRYVRVQLTGAASMVAIRYGHHKQVTSQDAAMAVAQSFVSPHA